MKIPQLFLCLYHIFFPKLCICCHNDISGSPEPVCGKCLDSLALTRFENWRGNRVEQMFWGRTKIEFAFAGYYFRKNETIQNLIHRFKYHGETDIAVMLGRQLGKMLKNSNNTYFDAVVPVPLHPIKKRIRGYNQCQFLALGISQITGIPVATDILMRTSYSESQTHKSRADRQLSVSKAFAVTREATKWMGARLLLVDDVVTTGATIEACCEALKAIPCVSIGVAAVGMADS